MICGNAGYRTAIEPSLSIFHFSKDKILPKTFLQMKSSQVYLSQKLTYLHLNMTFFDAQASLRLLILIHEFSNLHIIVGGHGRLHQSAVPPDLLDYQPDHQHGCCR